MSLLTLFKEADGKWSFSRVGSAFVIFSSVVWVSYLVFTQHKLPDNLASLAGYVGAAVGALYTGNQVAAAIQNNNNASG